MIGVTYSVMKSLHEYEAAANWIAKVSVDSTVKSLKDIGMTGLTTGAAAVEQLAWNKIEPLQPRLHTLTIKQLRDEIIGIGSQVALIEIELYSLAGDINGKMQIYFSKETALSIANELLGIPSEAARREYTDNITSTLKETASIFCNHYISVFSEYIRVPILSGVPAFRTGASHQIAESVTNSVAGKVEYALSTSIAFKDNKTGLLTVLLEPKSMDKIITKLN